MKKRKKIPVKKPVVKRKKRLIQRPKISLWQKMKKTVHPKLKIKKKALKKARLEFQLWLGLQRENARNTWQTWQVWQGVAGKKLKRYLKKSGRKLARKKNEWTEQIIVLSENRKVRRVAVSLSILALIFSSLFYWYILRDLPSPGALTSSQIPMTTRILDRNGKVLYRVYKTADRRKLNWEEIPDVVKNATVAIEDANFYHHHGISIKSIARAFLYNLKQDNVNLYQGGSTITQQLVRNRLKLGNKKTYARKAKEAILAVLTELRFSKKDILTMYLNEVGYGGPTYGIESAAQMYFGIPASKLTLGEAALLAGLPAAPTTFSPFGNNRELAFDRQKQVLERMLWLKMIDAATFDTAKSEQLAFAAQKIDIQAPHFVMFVKEKLAEKLGEASVTEGGLDVWTTLDLDLQKKAEEIVKKQIEQIASPYNIHNAAVLVTNPATGEILAMVGSANYFDIENKGYVNVTTRPRQPGSAIKPVNYGYAFDHGYTPTSIVADAPVVYTAKGSSEIYAPVNYDGRFHGNVTIRSALANSYNIPAVRVLNSYGVQNMIEQGRAMGIRSWNNLPPVGLSLTLGGAEVTMLDMARAYGTIANMGKTRELKLIKEIKNSDGVDLTDRFYQTNDTAALVGSVEAKELQKVPQEGKQVLSPLSSYWLIDILSDNAARMAAFGPYAKLTIPNHKVAVKTGTSNSFRDNWTIGFTPDFLTAVWVGNNDGSFMNKNLVSGITGAAPIWNEIMSLLLKDVQAKEFEMPKGLIPVKICAVNGLLTCPNCPSERTEYFTADKVPTQKCFFRSSSECAEAKKQAEGKSDEEKKPLLSGCPG